MIAAGVYFQSNYDSFLGNNGAAILKTALHLLKKGHIHCLATDSHNTAHRHPGNVAGAIKVLEKKIDKAGLKLLTRVNPDRVINNLPLESPGPAPGSGKGRRRWRWF